MCHRKPTLRARWRLFRALPGIFQAIGWGSLLLLLALILFPGPARAAPVAMTKLSPPYLNG